MGFTWMFLLFLVPKVYMKRCLHEWKVQTTGYTQEQAGQITLWQKKHLTGPQQS